MLTIYLMALAFGVVFIAASMLGGHGSDAHDADTGDGGADSDASADDHGHGLPKVLSLRFWTYALGAFGMTGSALTYLGTPVAVHVPLSAVTGLVVGTAVCWLFRKFQKGSAALPIDSSAVIGSEAEVVLPLSSEKTGAIRLRLANQDYEFMARSGDSEKLEQKQRVIVVRLVNGVAEVRPAPWQE